MEVTELIAWLNELYGDFVKREYSIDLSFAILALKESLSILISNGNSKVITKTNVKVPAEQLEQVQNLLKQFWTWYAETVPEDQWEIHEQADPWIRFQGKLMLKGILPSNYHHPLLFNVVKQRFALHGEKLELEPLLELLSATCRATGFVPIDNVEDYPLSIITDMKEQATMHDKRLQNIITHIAVLFALLFYYSCNKQTRLLFLAVNYRERTNLDNELAHSGKKRTKSEKFSETKLLHFLLYKTHIRVWFFRENEKYFDSYTLKDPIFLPFKAILPPTRENLLFMLNTKRWFFSFLSISLTGARSAVVPNMVCKLQEDFISQPDVSYNAALSYAASVSKYQGLLAPKNKETPKDKEQEQEADYLRDAVKAFCLQQYLNKRGNETDNTLRLFSRETKCNIAKREIRLLSGASVSPLSFWENIARSRGRLGDIINMPATSIKPL